MTLTELVDLASKKTNFTELADYIEFGGAFWDFTARPGAIQAEIVSRNETQYRFLWALLDRTAVVAKIEPREKNSG
jgi:hypothetical protein